MKKNMLLGLILLASSFILIYRGFYGVIFSTTTPAWQAISEIDWPQTLVGVFLGILGNILVTLGFEHRKMRKGGRRKR